MASTILLVAHRHWYGEESPPSDCPHMPTELWHRILSFVQRRDHGALDLNGGPSLPAACNYLAQSRAGSDDSRVHASRLDHIDLAYDSEANSDSGSDFSDSEDSEDSDLESSESELEDSDDD